MKRRLFLLAVILATATFKKADAQVSPPAAKDNTADTTTVAADKTPPPSPSQPDTLGNHVRNIPGIGTPSGGGFKGGTLDSIPVHSSPL